MSILTILNMVRLDRENYAPWIQSVRGAAASIQARYHITQDPNQPTDPVLQAIFDDKKGVPLSFLIEPISPGKANQIPIAELSTYYQLTSQKFINE